MNRSTPGLPVHHQLPESTQTHVHRVGDAIQPSHLLSSPSLLLLIFPSIRVFSNESVLHIRWPKYWSFSFSISPSNEYAGLISRMDWLDLHAVQGTLKGLFQHHSSKASILWRSAFFIVQLSHPCMTTGKTIALTRWIFVGKVMALLFNMLSRLVIAWEQGKRPRWLAMSRMVVDIRRETLPGLRRGPGGREAETAWVEALFRKTWLRRGKRGSSWGVMMEGQRSCFLGQESWKDTNAGGKALVHWGDWSHRKGGTDYRGPWMRQSWSGSPGGGIQDGLQLWV